MCVCMCVCVRGGQCEEGEEASEGDGVEVVENAIIVFWTRCMKVY